MKTFNCVTIDYYRDHELLLWKIKNTGMPNFCYHGLKEFKDCIQWIQSYFSHPDRPVKFVVSASEHEGIYNMGGDLPYFLKHIKTKDKEALTRYAHLCVDAIYAIYTAFGLPAISIALVEGNAYGGGFECALAHDFILAEEHAKFCFPEQKFNLFPGMGAYSFLPRKANFLDAQTILKNGELYSAKELYKKGLIHQVEQKGQTMMALYDFINKTKSAFNFEYHHIQCLKKMNPVSKEELIEITDLWVDACLKIGAFDLRKIEAFGNAQSRKAGVSLNATT
ncbi:crotonase/enoyl-CoA hydratase family protein [Aquimarina hainanensis]|uniref:Crotonase/enoyl-CoA hydratase family protein n=1 Tax=Aquimarina hainanensis TaxID=1578017 RepID=A0ABW5NC49_9FLAO